MVQFDFHQTTAYPINKVDNIFIRGCFESEDVYYYDANDYSSNLKTFFHEDKKESIRNINGNYMVIADYDDKVIVIADRINSFPIYYYSNGGNFIISDRLPQYGEINEEKMIEFLACGFVIGNETIYNNIYQMQAGQMLIYDKKKESYSCMSYFLHIHNNCQYRSEEELKLGLERAIEKTMDNMLKRVAGREIALFLSGGYDSKLIISELRKRNYEKVCCIILGSEKTKDVIAAKKIADNLNYRYVRVVVDKNYWRKKRNDGKIDAYFEKCSRFSSMPYLQGYVLNDLIEKGLISCDCVAVTGNSGDVVEGNDVTHRFYNNKKYEIEDIKKWIMERHFMLSGMKRAKYVSDAFDIVKYFKDENIQFKNGEISEAEAEDLIEYFNWRERQCKYVIQDVRNYDTYIGNIEWLLPLWDNNFVDFWLSVPYEWRRDRKLYYNYLGKDMLPTANKVSKGRKILEFLKTKAMPLFYPLYIVKAMIDYIFNDDFYFAPYGLVDVKQFVKLLWLTKGYREPHSENIACRTAERFH